MVLKGLGHLWTKLGWNRNEIALERLVSKSVVKDVMKFQKLSLKLKALIYNFFEIL